MQVWGEYRDAVATLVRQKVNVSAYDANHDGIIDLLGVIAHRTERPNAPF